MKNHSYDCVESMTRIKLGCYTIRVWRDRTELPVYERYDDDDLNEIVRSFGPVIDYDKSILLKTLSSVPGVNAVELIDRDGNGVVIYPSWP